MRPGTELGATDRTCVGTDRAPYACGRLALESKLTDLEKNPVGYLWVTLQEGPRTSRDVVQQLVEHGFTPKQIRGARERLQVVVSRAGSGKAMHSTWALPLSEQAPPPAVIDASDQCKQPATAQPPAGPAPESVDALLPHEEALVVRRTLAFVARGDLSGHAARELATTLVLKRDRAGERSGSCVECQNLVRPGVCVAAAAGHTAGPRELTEVWLCWLARRPHL